MNGGGDTSMMEAEERPISKGDVVNPFGEPSRPSVVMPVKEPVPLDDDAKTMLQVVADIKQAESSDQVVVIRSTGAPEGKLISDMDNSSRCKITTPIPTSEAQWEKVCRAAWPGIHARLREDPLFDNSIFSKRNAWERIYKMMEGARQKWTNQGGFITKVSEIPTEVNPTSTESVQRLVWPVGTNKDYACILYATIPKGASSSAMVTATAWILNISCENVVTSSDTDKKLFWRPKYKPVYLLDNNGRRQQQPSTSRKKTKSPSYKKLEITNIVMACLGIDDTALFVTRHEDVYTAHLFEIRPLGMIHMHSVVLPSKDPTSVACTKDIIILGYTGPTGTQMRGVYVCPRISEWNPQQVSLEPIASISASFDAARNVILMCGIDDDAHPDIRSIDLGPCASPDSISRIREHYDSGNGHITWRGQFWPSHEECMAVREKSKGKIKGNIRGPPKNCYTCEDTSTHDALMVMSSSDSVRICRFAEKTPELRLNTTMPGIGTSIGLGVYNDTICIHTPENSVLLGNIYVGNLSLDINNKCINADEHPATFYYNSVQMYHNRIVVLLATGQVSFFILQ